ncbi:hypothetical protein SAMN05660691_03822 [Rheinheimera pacifica]|uniref:Uncharacterized protein n=1 Tax=Rheinheimera pacifica TaxID=173990 RepID=A0A1H6NEY1_9GAMM|nr:hypothetical protein [Rheinheimera pacifica]SEI11426.1 hypothetical protein SAMN05660691_03822 [Rheinheimera pacifica]
MKKDLIIELSIADRGLPSELAKLHLDTNGQLSTKQLSIIESEISKASDCTICGEFAGFNGEAMCEEHEKFE